MIVTQELKDGVEHTDVIVLSVDGGHDVITGGSGNDTLDLSQIVFDAYVVLRRITQSIRRPGNNLR